MNKKLVLFTMMMLFPWYISYAGTNSSEEAKKYLFEGKYKQAIKGFKEILKKNKDYPEIYRLLAECYRSINNYEMAVVYYEYAIQVNPQDAWLHYNLSETYRMIGKDEEALKHLKKTIILQPKFIWARVKLASLYYYLRNYKEAKKECEAILALDSNNRDAMWYMAYVLHSELQYDEAEKWYTRLKELEPRYPHPYLGLWKICADRGMLEEGVKYLEQAKELSPGNKYIIAIMSSAHYELGRYYHYKKEFEKAETEYKKCLETNPNFIEAHFGLAAIYYSQAKWGKAVEEYENVPTTHPAYSEVLKWKNSAVEMLKKQGEE